MFSVSSYAHHQLLHSPYTTLFRSHCLLDYFPDDFMTVIDESHVTVPQIGGMYEGDASRKRTLVEHGFRLPRDRKSTRLNSSHVEISYAVFCLKKKKCIIYDFRLVI